MATVNVNSVTIRKNDQFDIECRDAGGRILALLNIKVISDGSVKVTYVKGYTEISFNEVNNG